MHYLDLNIKHVEDELVIANQYEIILFIKT